MLWNGSKELGNFPAQKRKCIVTPMSTNKLYVCSERSAWLVVCVSSSGKSLGLFLCSVAYLKAFRYLTLSANIQWLEPITPCFDWIVQRIGQFGCYLWTTVCQWVEWVFSHDFKSKSVSKKKHETCINRCNLFLENSKTKFLKCITS